MPPVVLLLLKGLFLLLLYLFVARAVRAVVRDVGTPGNARRSAAPVTATRTAARPAKRRPRLQPREIVVHAANARPRVLALDGAGDVSFGRSERSTFPLEDPYVSEHHARLYQEGGDWLVEDLGSTNGTFLNQVKVTTPTPVVAGDQVGIGKTVVEVRR